MMIEKRIPKFYEAIYEIDSLLAVENILFKELQSEINKALDNNFIMTAAANRIKEYEKILSIPETSNDINFRRERVLNRMAMNMPFTMKSLKQKLDSLIGADNYSMYIDYNNYTLYVESKILNQTWFTETFITVNKMKPANIVFVNKPLLTDNLLINEEVMLTQREYQYKLGMWKLGENPFAKFEDKGAVKLKENKSIQNYMLDELKNFTVNKIGYIKINGTFKISEFIKKEIIDNKIILEYAVNKSSLLIEVTKVEVYSIDDHLISIINLYVPLPEDIELKHIINIQEGVVDNG
ncbi:MAG: putative phage tail protein [Clostridium sp.]